MATIRPGHKKALLIVDSQVGVISDAWESERIVQNIAVVVEKARAATIPVIWVQHFDAELPKGSPAWQLAGGMQPTAIEAVIHKQFNSAFEQTNLEAELAKLDVSQLLLAGAATNWCIRATAYAAIERGYDLTLISDAHTTKSTDLGNGAVIDASHLVIELNIAMTWLEYPGRKNSTVTAAEVDLG